MTAPSGPLRVRWLGRVAYPEALGLQEALFAHGHEQHLLLLEHPHVFTHGARADLETNVLVDPAAVGATLVGVNRGGDVTYHGPGQLVGYPILSLPPKHGTSGSGLTDTVAYVRTVEQVIIDTLGELGLPNAGRLRDYPGVWIDADGPMPRKIAAIGVRLSRGRTMHGFALNVTTDMRYLREYIVPCGIADRPVTSLSEEGVDVSMELVAGTVARHAAAPGAGVGWSARTSRGAIAPTICRRSRVVRGRVPQSGARRITASSRSQDSHPHPGPSPFQCRCTGRRRCPLPPPPSRCASSAASPRPGCPTGSPSPPGSPNGSGQRCSTAPRCCN